MFFIVSGHFKSTAAPDASLYKADLNEHLGQRMINVRVAGALRDASGRETGFMVILEAADFAAAAAYLETGPYAKAGLYEHVEVAQYAVEVGAGQLK